MQKVFRVIKRKRNLRRVSVLWLCLVFIELFCPVFCDEPTFAATNNFPQTSVAVSIDETEQNSQTSVSASDHEATRDEKNTCNDECLCHATAALSLNSVKLKNSFNRHEQIAHRYGKPLFNSLPPPFEPPKNS